MRESKDFDSGKKEPVNPNSESKKNSLAHGKHHNHTYKHQASSSILDQQYHDDDLIKLGKLQFINASARFELLSANQQLLDFHLNRIMQKKSSKKVRILQNAGEATILQKNEERVSKNMVCEEIENESEGGTSIL